MSAKNGVSSPARSAKTARRAERRERENGAVVVGSRRVPRPFGEAVGLANGAVRQLPFAWTFSAAPKHDMYPHGGLRIVGMLPGSTGGTDFVINDTVTVGGWTATGIFPAGVCPTGAFVTGQCTALFSPTGPLAVFAQYFRQFRFRELDMEYTSSVSPADTTYSQKTVQVSYERDIVTACQVGAGGYTLASAVTEQSMRFPAWTPNTRVPLIVRTREQRDDQLFWMTQANDGVAAAGDAEQRQAFQGALTCVLNSVGAADTTLGSNIFFFTVDLYGFSNVATDVLPSAKREAAAKPPPAIAPPSRRG